MSDDNPTVIDAARDIAREFGHDDISDRELDALLWEYTSFPFGEWSEVSAQLRDYIASNTGNVESPGE